MRKRKLKKHTLRRKLANLATHWLSWALQLVVRRLSLRSVRWLADRVADLLFGVLRYRRRDMDANLRTAFGDRLDRAQRRRIAKAATRSFVRTVLEFVKSPQLSDQDMHRLVRVRDFDRFRRAAQAGQGLILLCAHVGNWELLGARLARDGWPIWVIAREHNDDYTASLMRRIREANNMRVVPRDDLRQALRCLRSGEVLGILPDTNVAHGGLLVDFLGRPATTAPGPALFAMRTGAAVMPCFAVRQPDDTYLIEFAEPLNLVDTGDREADLFANTRLMNRAIEDAIRRHPEQWLWMHRRWKSAPDGQEPSDYRLPPTADGQGAQP
ncbi:MAG: lysophospholipid acyltransferase family protein [Armatimonadota bacterium]